MLLGFKVPDVAVVAQFRLLLLLLSFFSSSMLRGLGQQFEQSRLASLNAQMPQTIGPLSSIGAPTARTQHDIYFGRHDARCCFA